MKRKKIREWKRILSWILCAGILVQSVPVYAAEENPVPYERTEAKLEEEETAGTMSEISDNEPSETTPEKEDTWLSEDVEKAGENKNVEEKEQTGENSLQMEKEDMGSTDVSKLYKDGKIRIYNLKQLQAVGTGKAVHLEDDKEETYGSGEELKTDGKTVTYSLDAAYEIMNDIPLDAKKMWTLPEGFSGTFQGTQADENAPLYDAKNDTIFIYHNYQLLTAASKEAEKEPVMSKDMIPAKFGIGKLLYQDGSTEEKKPGEAQEYLTYGKEHHYVLSKNFTEQMPELEANQYVQGSATDEQKGGRAHVGQVYTTIGDEKYILVGNEQQLRAIGSGKQVTPMLFVRTEVKFLIGIFHDVTLIPYYPGDADFNLRNIDETGVKVQDVKDETENFQYFQQDNVPEDLWDPDFDDSGLLGSIVRILEDILGGILSIIGSSDSEIVGLVNEGTENASIGKSAGGLFGEKEYKPFSEIKKEYKDLKYTSDANYIIFRDIDLSSGAFSNEKEDNWQPIAVHGKVEGRKNMKEGEAVSVSNITVEQTGEKLYFDKQMGIGFFSTIGNRSNTKADVDSIGESAGKTEVSNLQLHNVSVVNHTTEAGHDDGLIQGILVGVAELVGGILDGIGNIPGLGDLVNALLEKLGIANLDQVVEGLLDNVSKDPTLFATGAFAGRIVGDVKIENCTVDGGTGGSVYVENAKADAGTGGFAGSITGIPKYGGLSDTLDAVVKLLTALLNIIPGLDIGTVIDVLLGENGIISAGTLIPVGYYSPEINGCRISGFKDQTLGNEQTNYVGGFAGKLTGATVLDTTVGKEEETLTVKGNTFTGGFSGVMQNGMVSGLLNEAGLDLVEPVALQTITAGTGVYASALTVTGRRYAGGYTGAMANSYSVNDTVSGLYRIETEENYAGGFAGKTTIGWAAVLGKEFGNEEDSLLGTVGGLLGSVTAGDKQEALLSLAGVCPSAIAGAKIQGVSAGYTVNAKTQEGQEKSFAGGLYGDGDGTKVFCSDTDNLNSLTGWTWRKEALENALDGITERKNEIRNLGEVSASGNFAGGLAGAARTASAGGVLNNTLGLIGYLPFEFSDTAVSMTGAAKITGKSYAAGGIGSAIGGNVERVTVSSLSEVTAEENYAGGFAGSAGAADVAAVGGLDILGLGLIKIDSLLSLGDSIVTAFTDTEVNGAETGLCVKAKGEHQTVGSHMAGGFVGSAETGKLLDVAKEKSAVLEIVDIDGLLGAVSYLLPKMDSCTASFIQNKEEHSGEELAQVTADMAGGFAGEMQSAQVNAGKTKAAKDKVVEVSGKEKEIPAVTGLKRISGVSYAGGFAGKIEAGGLADAAGGGLGLLEGLLGDDLSVNITGLLNVFRTYIPHIYYADVRSLDIEDTKDIGFTVEAEKTQDSYAGGYAGYAGGTEITGSDVNRLKKTKVTAPADLETNDKDTSAVYFNKEESAYAVKASSSAGGFAGTLDIGNVAAVGEGIGLLGNIVAEAANLLDILDVAASKVTDCDVQGSPGGYNVLASGGNGEHPTGHAGGFVGNSKGAQITDADALNFEYIIGQESAGGYAGKTEPGNVASVAEDAEVLEGLVSVTNLAQVLRSFVPFVKDSKTTAVPCGGIVRAEGMSTETNNGKEKETRERGMAGGFVGYSLAGQIEGKEKECAVYRLRSVYGGEFAGGFAGLMQTANVADTGSLNLLYGVIDLENPIQLLDAVYPVTEKTAVYGPLRGLTKEEWDNWVAFVGKDGAYGELLKTFPENMRTGKEKEELQELTFEELIERYAYGYDVRAGRTEAGRLLIQGGAAGGYTGRMEGGVITDAYAKDLKEVRAMRSAGGFAGEMMTGNVLKAGGISIGKLDIIGHLDALDVFVPVINGGTAEGYQSGARIEAYGIPKDGEPKTGYAGGYVGHMVGGQIGMEKDANDIKNLRRVQGNYMVGGYAGEIESGSALDVNPDENGLLNQILSSLLIDSESLAKVLDATISTVDSASANAVDDWGFSVQGSYYDGEDTTAYALAAGGFAGAVEGAIIGNKGKREETAETAVTVSGVREVTGGQHAGGFIGYADAGSAVALSDNKDGEKTTILELIGLGKTEIADMFRSYIFHSTVTGSKDNGLKVTAAIGEKLGSEETGTDCYTGNAGGFAGTFHNSTVEDTKVSRLHSVTGINNAGGFIGYAGKSGLIDLEEVSVGEQDGGTFNLLNGAAGVLDVFGSTVKGCLADGIESGFTVKSSGGIKERAGGFIGNADLTRITDSHVKNIKQTASDYRAGGFAGETSFAYLAQIKLDSELVSIVTTVLGAVLEALWIGKLEDLDLISLGIPGFLEIKLLGEGNAVSVNLLGLKIKIQLVKAESLAKITIGDSEIVLKRGENGKWSPEDGSAVEISLIKANRTKIDGCTVEGTEEGYDVFGAGASQKEDGKDKTEGFIEQAGQEGKNLKGAAGGFVGYNKEGLLENNEMKFCDTIRSSANTAGTFTGVSDLDTSYDYNQKEAVEGKKNRYRIYRRSEDGTIKELDQIEGITSRFIKEAEKTEKEKAWSNIYEIQNLDNVDPESEKEDFLKLKDRKMTDETGRTADLNAYISPAKAVLMEDAKTEENEDSLTPEPPDMQDPCDEMLRLDISKVWDDKSDKDDVRPEEIYIDIWRTPDSEMGQTEDGEGVQPEYVTTVKLTKNDETTNKNIWKETISNLPAWILGKDEEGKDKQYYFRYSVTERPVTNYETSIANGKGQQTDAEGNAKDDPFSFVITNEYQPPLPDTGGIGLTLIYLLGILLLLSAVAMGCRKKRGKQDAKLL